MRQWREGKFRWAGVRSAAMQDRSIQKLCDMGYDPDTVQREVNRQLSQNEAPAEYYVVQENDTLSEIAKCFATTYLELAAWNGIADPNMIYVGQKIRIR